MRKLSHSLLPFLALLAFLACSDDNKKLTFAALVGDWDVVEGLWIDASDAANRVNIEDEVNGVITFSITSDQTWTWYLDGFEWATWDVELHGDTLTLDPGPDAGHYRAQLSGSDLTLTGLETFPYDLDGDGTDEDAYELIRARRLPTP